jgi:hypothetical protein
LCLQAGSRLWDLWSPPGVILSTSNHSSLLPLPSPGENHGSFRHLPCAAPWEARSQTAVWGSPPWSPCCLSPPKLMVKLVPNIMVLRSGRALKRWLNHELHPPEGINAALLELGDWINSQGSEFFLTLMRLD